MTDTASEIQRCYREIANREQMLRDGALPLEMEGLLQGLQDWSAELRLLQSLAKKAENFMRMIGGEFDSQVEQ